MSLSEPCPGKPSLQMLAVKETPLAGEQSGESCMCGGRNSSIYRRPCLGTRMRSCRQIGSQARSYIYADIRVIHRQMHDRQRARAERRAGLLVFSVGVTDAVRFERDVVPIQNRVVHHLLLPDNLLETADQTVR